MATESLDCSFGDCIGASIIDSICESIDDLISDLIGVFIGDSSGDVAGDVAGDPCEDCSDDSSDDCAIDASSLVILLKAQSSEGRSSERHLPRHWEEALLSISRECRRADICSVDNAPDILLVEAEPMVYNKLWAFVDRKVEVEDCRFR